MKHFSEIMMAIAMILAILACALPAWDVDSVGNNNQGGVNVGFWELCDNAGSLKTCTSAPAYQQASVVAVKTFSILSIIAFAASMLLYLRKHKFAALSGILGVLFATITLIVYCTATRKDMGTCSGDVCFYLGPSFYLEIGAIVFAIGGLSMHSKKR